MDISLDQEMMYFLLFSELKIHPELISKLVPAHYQVEGGPSGGGGSAADAPEGAAAAVVDDD